MESHHDEEKENAVLEDRPHYPGHARLAEVGFELQDEDDNAKEGKEVCMDVRFLGICETVGNKYQRARPVTYRPTRRSQGR